METFEHGWRRVQDQPRSRRFRSLWAVCADDPGLRASHPRRLNRSDGVSTAEHSREVAAVLDALKAAAVALQAVERAVDRLADVRDEGDLLLPARTASADGIAPAPASTIPASAATPAADPGPPQTDAPLSSITVAHVEQWLAKRGASLREYRRPSSADGPLDRVAAQIGGRFELTEPLLCAARRAASSGRSRTLHLRDHGPEAVGAITASATRLHDLGLLSYARYERSVAQLHIRVADAGVAFLGGGWLERWAALRATDALAVLDRAGLVLRGVQIVLADDREVEIDLLVLADGLDPLVVECRTGAYQDRLDRDVRVRRALGLTPEQAIVVLSGAGRSACSELSAIHGLQITTLEGLDAVYAAALTRLPEQAGATATVAATRADRAPCAAPARAAHEAPVDDPVVIRDVETIRATLRRSGLRPHPKQRRAILAAVATALAGGPRSARELKAAVAERAGTSRSAAHDILTALARGQGLLGVDGTPLTSLGEDIGALVSPDCGELEACCRRAWRVALCAHDPTLLATPAADRCFAIAVGDDRP